MIRHLRLVGEMLRPWIEIVGNDNTQCIGIQCKLIKYLSSSLNFTFEIFEEKAGPGYELQNGSWTGMMGRIQRNVSSISIERLNK